MSAHNRTGALGTLLAPLSEAGVSMTRLESRPARHTLWEYVFYVDFAGSVSEERCRRALGQLEEMATFVRVLGSYPRAWNAHHEE